MNHTTRILISSMLLLAPAFMAVAEETSPAASMAETIITPATEILDVVQKFNLPLDAKACSAAIMSSVIKVADPLSSVMSEAEASLLKDNQQGIIYEPAITFTISNSLPRISSVGESLQAQLPTLKTNDLIEKIDDTELLADMNSLVITRLLRDTRPTSVVLTLRSPEGKTNALPVPRAQTRLPAVAATEELPVHMCYLKINGLYEGCGKDIETTLKGWSETTNYFGVVIDLRGANGTDLASAAEIAGLFSENGGLLFTLRDSSNQDMGVYKSTSSKMLGMPAMVLVDNRTTGAAEALAAALSASVRGAMLIGGVTAGDPMVRELVPLPSGQQLYIATRKLVMADGKVYNGREGIKPDIIVLDSDNSEPVFEGDIMLAKKELSDEEKEDRQLRERVHNDSSLRRAVDILLGLKALNIRGLGYSENATP
ncbi:MAG: S41 family peptidase [Lentisphaerota bacterium]